MQHLVRNICLLACLLGVSTPAVAQHPIEVQRHAADGEHLRALVAFDRLPRRRATLESRISAARSAWALGLSDRALEEFDKALNDDSLPDSQRARLQLSKGIIEYQEERHRVAMLYAEKAIALLPNASPLRSKAWLLWGDALYELNSVGAASQKYVRALAEGAALEQADIYYRLGLCQLRLGDSEAAEKSFQQIPLDHDRASSAIRHLAQIAFDSENIDHAGFWLSKGRADFPEEFLDSWVDYALLRVALSKGEEDQARDIQSQAEKKYPPSDYWLTMLQASSAAYHWKKLGKSSQE